MRKWRIRGLSKSGNSWQITVNAEDYFAALKKAIWHARNCKITECVLISE